MEKLVIIRTLDQVADILNCIQQSEYIAVDTETTGTGKDAKIIGISVCADENVGYYIILAEWNAEQQKLIDLETVTAAKQIAEALVGKSLIMHNAVFDCWMINNNYGVDLMPSVHTDTMIMAHLLDENRHNGLKELGLSLFGEDAVAEQKQMKESVHKNGGKLTKDCFQMYMADSELLAKYGAKDAILTLKLFYVLVEQLFEQGLEKFFYEDESMPLLRGPTYDLNTTGLRVEAERLRALKKELEAFALECEAFIYKEIEPHVSEKYPGTSKKNKFSITAPKQLSWLLFVKLGNYFEKLTDEGRNVCKALNMKPPYSFKAKRDFIDTLVKNKGRIYEEAKYNPKTKKMGRPKKVGEPWHYLAADKATLKTLAHKYKWVAKLLEYTKNQKLLHTYVEGIEERMSYNIIRPSFLQHGTTSGRYSSKNPNFQNLPRDDKRVKNCIVARPGKIFVGADYSQLEPRVFASFSGDERLLSCFKSGDDFYSLIGATVFEKNDCSLKKDEPNSFANKYKELRNIAKVVALSATYGTTAPKMAPQIYKDVDEAQEVINDYFEKFPKVKQLMLDSHEMAKKDGFVLNLFGRKRRMPKAKAIPSLYGKTPHEELPYEARNMLNLAINHRIQSTGASIMNRAAIQAHRLFKDLAETNPKANEIKIVMQVHDELILEGPEELANEMKILLKDAMENTVELPGVDLIAEPVAAKNLADLK